MDARLTHIDEAEVLRYLGARSVAGDTLRQMRELLMDTARPRLVWRRLPRNAQTEALIVGSDLRRLLAQSCGLVLFAATLGLEAERLVQRMQARDMALALILDACAGCAIENVCDNFCIDLQAELAPLRLTRRFSPGYGDLPLSHQALLFDTLDVTRRIGVSLTPSGMMLPQKSVTAIMGLE